MLSNVKVVFQKGVDWSIDHTKNTELYNQQHCVFTQSPKGMHTLENN